MEQEQQVAGDFQPNPKVSITGNFAGFYGHVAANHFGDDFSRKSIFRSVFQNLASILSLADFTANAAPLRTTDYSGLYRYTAQYSGTVGYLQGSGVPTDLITYILRDTGARNAQGQRVMNPVTLYPGAALP
jgi:hypothetical protein